MSEANDDISIDDEAEDVLDPSAADTASEAANEPSTTDDDATDEGEANESEGDGQQAAETTADDGDVVVMIGDEPPPAEEDTPAPEWVRELRKNHRELVRENRELKAKLSTPTAETKPAELGKKPTLEDHDYDAEQFEAALTSWHERKRAAEAAETQRRAQEEAQQQAWQGRIQTYAEAKTTLKVKDFDDAEAVVLDHLSVTQQGIVVKGAENPALVIYALGKNPTRAKQLAAISDPVEFAFAVAKLETKLKITTKKAPPPPERAVSGNGRVATGGADATLERLREEAARTGDMTKVTAYKRKLRASKAA
jgi:hypothetical protein